MISVGGARAHTRRVPAVVPRSRRGVHTAPATRTDFNEELRRRITYRTGPRLRYAEPNRSEHDTGCRIRHPPHLSLSCVLCLNMAVRHSQHALVAGSRPARRAIKALFSSRRRMTPVPTVPRPARPTLSGAIREGVDIGSNFLPKECALAPRLSGFAFNCQPRLAAK